MGYTERRRRLHSVTPWRTPGVSQETFDAVLAQKAPRVPWDVFRERLVWKQSEHVALIGPNGSGKTNLLISLLPERDFVVFMATKPRDRTLEELIIDGEYDLYHEWLDVPAAKSPRRILWPDARSMEADERQRKVFLDAFHAIYDEGNWCLAIDEGYYVATELKLSAQMRKYWTQVRSLDVSFVVGTQRPAWVPVEMYSESTHVFLWSMVEHEAVRRVSSLGRANVDLVREIIPQLEEHQFLYVNTRTGALYRSYAPYKMAAEPYEHKGGDTG
jgi:hypothetical protein